MNESAQLRQSITNNALNAIDFLLALAASKKRFAPPDGPPILADTLFSQVFMESKLTIYDFYLVGLLALAISHGDAVIVPLLVGSTPRADKDPENALVIAGLKKTYPNGIKEAVFTPGTSGCPDGHIEFNAPIYEGVSNTCFPLEVGYCNASQSFTRMMDYGCMARWPYGSEDIWLIAYTDEHRKQLGERVRGGRLLPKKNGEKPAPRKEHGCEECAVSYKALSEVIAVLRARNALALGHEVHALRPQ